MDTVLTKDARGFVDGVVGYLKKDTASKNFTKVQAFLGRVTATTKKEKLAVVESSVVLTNEEKEDIKKMLNRILGRDVEVESVVKPEILGGLRIQVADWILDTTLKSQLEKMATVLVQS